MTQTAAHSAHDIWLALPAPARRALARGSVGRDHLVGLSASLLSLAAGAAPANRAGLAALVQDLLVSAWAASPLDGGLAQLCSGQPWPGWPRLPEHLDDTLKAQANFWRPPASADPWQALPAGPGAWAERRAMLRARQQAEPKNLFWKAEAWAWAWPRADWDLADEALRPASWPRTLEPLRLQALAQALLLRGDAAAALAELDRLGAFFPGGSPLLRAECLLRLGREAEAVDALAGAVARAPWRGSEVLRLSDLASGAAGEVLPVPGGVAVLLYTWNKARELDETLQSLAASELQGARLWVLDNGSSDATPQVLDAWRGRLGEAMSVLRLPVNIGAPAARNWLLSLPEVRARDFLVFLDDDVTLPGDWLGRLGAAAGRFPEASVWGCRVVDAANALVVQSVDYTPQAARPDDQGGQPGSLPISLPSLHQGQPDLGQFAYLRPCVSVTGCCHLLRTADIERIGGFDIRFSPSQYDDLERDLRLFMGGGHAVYQGHLAVGHKRSSGQLAERSPAETGNATANTHKLVTKHAAGDLAALCERGQDMLERDMERRLRQLATVLPKA